MIDLKHPEALQHEGRQYLPVVEKGGVRAAVLPGSKVGLWNHIRNFLISSILYENIKQGLVESLDVKAVVTLQENIDVPPMPEIVVPER